MPEQESATDILLVPSPYARGRATPERPQAFFDASHRLHEDVWIQKPTPDLIELVAKACTAPGHNFSPIRQYGFPYAFARHNAPLADPYLFDPDSRLLAAVALSRLVYPTSVGFGYAARIIRREGSEPVIVAAHITGLNRHAFVLDDTLDWLIPSDIDPLSELIAAYHARPRPKRVSSALWHREFAARAHYVDQRLPALVTGLEALVHINGERDPKSGRYAGSTRVFRQRCSQLGSQLSVPATSEADLQEIYELRSGVVHGQGFAGLDPRTLAQITTAERLLSAALRRAILDPQFSVQFDSDANIQSSLPLS